MMEKLATTKSAKRDYKKELKHLYAPSAKEVSVVEVPAMNFIMLDGRGDPNTAKEFKDAIEALYVMAYTIKFMLKKEAAFDYVVMPPEGLWWSEDGRGRDANREDWRWTMMIMQPDELAAESFARALATARQKKDLPNLDQVRLECLAEDTAVQIMHIGPFADEEQTLAKMERFIEERGYIVCGKHHEIYLTDLRKTVPEKMRTVLRHPVQATLK